jgi:hypothetical protein
MPKDTNFKQNLCADMQGLSLHAAVRCGEDDRQVLEQLCRHIARPSLADEWPVCGGQIHWLYDSSGSSRDLRGRGSGCSGRRNSSDRWRAQPRAAGPGELPSPTAGSFPAS